MQVRLTSGSYYCRVRLTLHATRRTPHVSLRAWREASDACLVGENPTCSVPAFVGDARVYGHTTTAMHEIEYASPIEHTSPIPPPVSPVSPHARRRRRRCCCCCCCCCYCILRAGVVEKGRRRATSVPVPSGRSRGERLRDQPRGDRGRRGLFEKDRRHGGAGCGAQSSRRRAAVRQGQEIGTQLMGEFLDS